MALNISKASLSNDGATTHSKKLSLRLRAVSSSTLALNATMPPNALVESHFNAFLKELDAELLIEAPQGLLCFKITAATDFVSELRDSSYPNSITVERADSRSSKLL